MRLMAIFFLVVGTCAFAPNGIRDFDPPPHYYQIYQQAVECTKPFRNPNKEPRPYAWIQWSTVPGHDFKCENGMRCIGHWQGPNEITIAEDWRTTDWVQRHEMVHYLLQRGHWVGDTAVFGRACHAMWGYLPQDPNYVP